MRYEKIFICFLAVFLSLTLILGAWPLGKTTTCNMLNATTYEECDILWCEIIDCSYNYSNMACSCPYGGSIVINNQTINQTGFYNKTEIDALLNSLNTSIKNYTINNTDNDWRNHTDTSIMALRDSLSDRLDEEIQDLRDYVRGYGGSSNAGGIDTGVLIGIVVIIAGLIGFMSWNSRKTAEKREDRKEAKGLKRKFRKIDVNKYQGELEDINKLEKPSLEETEEDKGDGER